MIEKRPSCPTQHDTRETELAEFEKQTDKTHHTFSKALALIADQTAEQLISASRTELFKLAMMDGESELPLLDERSRVFFSQLIDEIEAELVDHQLEISEAEDCLMGELGAEAQAAFQNMVRHMVTYWGMKSTCLGRENVVWGEVVQLQRFFLATRRVDLALAWAGGDEGFGLYIRHRCAVLVFEGWWREAATVLGDLKRTILEKQGLFRALKRAVYQEERGQRKLGLDGGCLMVV